MCRYRVQAGSVMEEFPGKCATCTQWSGARLSGLVDSHGLCVAPEMAERFLEEEGEDGWYSTFREDTCEFYEEFSGIERTDHGFRIGGMNPFQLIAEADAMGFDVTGEVADMIANAIRDFTDGADKINVPGWETGELQDMYDSICRLNIRCEEPAYIPKGKITGEGC